MKQELRNQAIDLRQKGLTYNQILKKVPVAKSTLSLWLRSFGLSTKQTQVMTKKRLSAIRRGHRKWKQMRIERVKGIVEESKAQIEQIEVTSESLFLMGIMLYWAEGSKEKESKPGRSVYFSNSDPKMITFFLNWLILSIKIPEDEIQCDIYLHESHKNRVEEVRNYWINVTGLSADKFGKIYFKKNKISTRRKNTGSGYHGLVRVRVIKSSTLNRRISGWIEGIYLKCPVVQR